MSDEMRVEGIEGKEGEIHDPAVFLQFIQRHVCPRRRVKSSESVTLTVMAPQLQDPSIISTFST